MARIFPSLIAAPPLKLQQAIEVLESYCAGFHIDVIDGNFAPPISIGSSFVNALRQIAQKPFWLHLMVNYPEVLLEQLSLHPGDLVSVHYEQLSNRKTHQLIETYHARNIKIGLAIKPKTPIEVIKHFDRIIDHVLLLGVEPGFSGQMLLPETHQRLQNLYDLREEHSLSFSIALDGGVNLDTLPLLVQEGGDLFAVGSGIFSVSDPIKTLEIMKKF